MSADVSTYVVIAMAVVSAVAIAATLAVVVAVAVVVCYRGLFRSCGRRWSGRDCGCGCVIAGQRQQGLGDGNAYISNSIT